MWAVSYSTLSTACLPCLIFCQPKVPITLSSVYLRHLEVCWSKLPGCTFQWVLLSGGWAGMDVWTMCLCYTMRVTNPTWKALSFQEHRALRNIAWRSAPTRMILLICTDIVGRLLLQNNGILLITGSMSICWSLVLWANVMILFAQHVLLTLAQFLALIMWDPLLSVSKIAKPSSAFSGIVAKYHVCFLSLKETENLNSSNCGSLNCLSYKAFQFQSQVQA